MAEYWKSTGKKYCDFCKCWTADNKASIEFHERGKNHQANVKKRLGEIKKNSIEKRRKDEASQKMFDNMEKAALAAVQKDISSGTSIVGRSDMKNIVSAHAVSNAETGSDTYPWKEMKAPQGFTYYYNCLTGESSWTMPEIFKTKKEKEDREKRDKEVVHPKSYHDDRKKKVVTDDPYRTKEKKVIEEVSEEVHSVHPLLGGWSTVTRYEVEPDEETEDKEVKAEQKPNDDSVEPSKEETSTTSQIVSEEQEPAKAQEPERKSGKKFKEKVMTSSLTTTDEPVAFKKRKSKSRSMRKRDEDD